MEIFYDGVAFENRHQHGIQRYFRELIGRLGPEYHAALWIGHRRHVLLPENCRCTVWPLGSRVRRQAFRLYWAGRRRPDIFHSTYFSLPPPGRVPVVQTLHDMIPEIFRDEVGGWWRLEAERKLSALRRAGLVICISEATRRDAARIYPDLAGRLRVVHHGADHMRVLKASSAPAGNYALVVGDRAGYKNFAVVLAAMGSRAWPAQLKLLVAGPAFTEAEGPLITETGRSALVTHLGRPDDGALFLAMRSAAAVVYPSLLEGFGFPILEAQSAGVPIICGDIPVFHEVGGEGPIFFDPRSPDSLNRALDAALDPGRRRAAAELGFLNVRRFTWQRCARETEAVYTEAAGNIHG